MPTIIIWKRFNEKLARAPEGRPGRITACSGCRSQYCRRRINSLRKRQAAAQAGMHSLATKFFRGKGQTDFHRYLVVPMQRLNSTKPRCKKWSIWVLDPFEQVFVSTAFA